MTARNGRIGLRIGLLLLLPCLCGAATNVAISRETELTRFEYFQVEMAVPIKMVLYASNEDSANCAAKAAYARFHQLNAVMSDYDPESEVRKLGYASGGGVAVPVSDDLWRVMQHAAALSRRSDGAFDVTISPVVRLWRRARHKYELPPPVHLEEARQLVGQHLLKFDADRQAIELTKPDMRIDLGGIAKGDAIDQAMLVLREHGIDCALIDAGGDIALGTAPPEKPGWVIGVAALEKDGPLTRYLSLSNVAIATSGDTWQYVEIDGRRYSHLVDPRTGVGLTDHSSVTIIAPDAITADSLASAVSVLGPSEGLKLIDATPGTAALIIRAPEDKIEVHESSHWNDYPKYVPE